MATKNGSPDLGQGKPSKQSECPEFTSSESTEKEAISKYKCILQTWDWAFSLLLVVSAFIHEVARHIGWANKIAMLPFDIAIAFLAASWGTQNGSGFPACFAYHLFLLMLVLGFFSSGTGIILWSTFPKAARGFYLVAFLFILTALTIFFSSLLPSNLKDVPWICFTFVLLVVFGLCLRRVTPEL